MSALAWLWIVALAAPPSSEADEERARALFKEAATARAEGRWAEVRKLLEASLEAHPQFATVWNLVSADERLDDFPAAESLLVRLKAGEFGALPAKEMTAVVTRLERLSKGLGTIRVEVAGGSGTIRLDGAERGHIESGASKELRVALGTHVVAIVAADGRSVDSSVDVAAQQVRALRIAVPPPIVKSHLVVEAENASRLVEVVGVAQAVGRLDLELEPREYRVSLVGVGAEQDVDLRPGTSQRVVLADPSSIWSSPWLWIALGVAVTGGAVAIGVALRHRGPEAADFTAPPL
jgi:hypothetical protein